MNPYWKEIFTFTVQFPELAFLRFGVYDALTNNTLIAQRIIPLKQLKQGYRYVPLYSPTDTPLDMASLFIFSRQEDIDEFMNPPRGGGTTSSINSGSSLGSDIPVRRVAAASVGPDSFMVRRSFPSKNLSEKGSSFGTGTSGESSSGGVAIPGRLPAPIKRTFNIKIYGLISDKSTTILKVSQNCTAKEVVTTALSLSKHVAMDVCPDDFKLVEEVHQGWDCKVKDANILRRTIESDEYVFEVQQKWRGQGKFIIQRKDGKPNALILAPGTTTGSDVGMPYLQIPNAQYTLSPMGWTKPIHEPELALTRTDHHGSIADQFFHVCVHNQCTGNPVMFKALINATALDIVVQTLRRSKIYDDPHAYVLTEEIEVPYQHVVNSMVLGMCTQLEKRALHDEENVYLVQSQWTFKSRFLLIKRLPSRANQSGDSGVDSGRPSITQQARVNKQARKSLTTWIRGTVLSLFEDNRNVRSQSVPESRYRLARPR